MDRGVFVTLRRWTTLLSLPAARPRVVSRWPELASTCEAGVEVADTQAVRAAWRNLGQQLAARRKVAKLSQQDLAERTTFSRSSVANIEIGRQHVDRAFWEKADAQVGAGGELVRGYDGVEALHRAHQRRRTQPVQAGRQAVNVLAFNESPSVPVENADLPASAKTTPHFFPISWGRDGYTASGPRLAELSVDTAPPTAVGWNDVDQVRFFTRALAHSENTFGGGFSGEAAVAQLKYSALLLNLDPPMNSVRVGVPEIEDAL